MDELWSWNWVVFVVPVCWASLWSRVEVAIKCTTESHVSCDQSLLISKTMNSSQRLKLIQITSITQFIATEFRHTKERKRQPSHKFVFFLHALSAQIQKTFVIGFILVATQAATMELSSHAKCSIHINFCLHTSLIVQYVSSEIWS